jgi:hypothetical protein
MTLSRLQVFKTEIATKQAKILELQTKLSEISTPVAKQLYRERIEQLQLRIDLLDHTISLHKAYKADFDNLHQLEQAFAILHNKLYPPLHPDLIKGTLNRKKTLKKIQILKKNHPDFYASLQDRITPFIDKDFIIHNSRPSQEVYRGFWEIIELDCKGCFEGVEFTKPEYTYTDTKKILLSVLDNISQKYNFEQKWRVVKLKSRKTFSVLPESKVIKVPNGKTPKPKLIGLIYHEIIVHIVRGELAKKHKLLNPLPNYRPFEEGLAKTIQQLSLNSPIIKNEFYTQPLIITLSSLGLSFEEITQFLFLTKNPGAKRHLERAKRRTIKRRFMLNEIDYNVLHNKDISYGVGGVLLQKLVEKFNQEIDNSELKNALREVFKKIFYAKFDPTNSSHIAYLEETKILNLTINQSKSLHSYINSEEITSISRTIPKML